MAELHLENVPDELLRQIEQLAQHEHRTPAEKAIRLLQEAVRHESARQRQGVVEILERIRKDPIIPLPDMPDSVELLREDRSR
jgi:hypothetical protein